jgi:hypothetical protein
MPEHRANIPYHLFREWRVLGRNDEVIEQKALQRAHAVCCGA